MLRSYIPARASLQLSSREPGWWTWRLLLTAVDTRGRLAIRTLVSELLLRVDVIPASLVLAQAANRVGLGHV